MVELLFLFIWVCDSIIVGGIFFLLVKLFGDSPLLRIISVFSAIIGGLFYFWLIAYMNSIYATEITPMLIVSFAPIALMAVLALISYAFDGKK